MIFDMCGVVIHLLDTHVACLSGFATCDCPTVFNMGETSSSSVEDDDFPSLVPQEQFL